MKVLVLNSGSSSQKAALYEVAPKASIEAPAPFWRGETDWHAGTLKTYAKGAARTIKLDRTSPRDALKILLRSAWTGSSAALGSPAEINVVGHRVVHGGPHYREPVVITPEVKTAINNAAVFAPLHNDSEIAGMEVAESMLGRVTQIAVFDTGFHRHLPPAAAFYPGPYEWIEQGIVRYGFHGINHEYCAQRAAQLLNRDLTELRLISCHLGNGCSLAAIRDGRSIDTTMGFTPLEGLMMGTRSGSVDPGILTYLLRQKNISPEDLDSLLNKRSGLAGISGSSGDMRDIESAVRRGDARAQLAFDIFIHRLQSGIGAMAASLAGVDALVFTAGIGENSPAVRTAACAPLGFLGVVLDQDGNNRYRPDGDANLSAATSRSSVLVINAQEAWAIARICANFVQN